MSIQKNKTKNHPLLWVWFILIQLLICLLESILDSRIQGYARTFELDHSSLLADLELKHTVMSTLVKSLWFDSPWPFNKDLKILLWCDRTCLSHGNLARKMRYTRLVWWLCSSIFPHSFLTLCLHVCKPTCLLMSGYWLTGMQTWLVWELWGTGIKATCTFWSCI